MTVTTTVARNEFLTDGATKIWPFNFEIPDAESVVVELKNNTTLITAPVSSSQYTVSGVGNPSGGSVTYPAVGPAIIAGFTVIVRREVPYRQDTDLRNQDGFYPEVLEDALDNLEFQIQQVKSNTDAALDTINEFLSDPDEVIHVNQELEEIFNSITAATISTTNKDVIAINYPEGTTFYEYYTDTDAAANKAKFTTANGRKYRRRGKVLTLRDVGGFNAAAASHTQLLIDLGSELRWRGAGQRVEFPDNAVIKVATDTEMAGQAIGSILTLIGEVAPCRNSVFNFNGSEIQVLASSFGEIIHSSDALIGVGANATDTSKFVELMRCTDTANITINDINARQVNATQIRNNYYVKSGTTLLYILGNTKEITLNNPKGTDIYRGVVAERTGSYAPSSRARGLEINGPEFMDCYYGMSFQKNMDHVRIYNYRSRCRRGYFVYGAHDHEVHMESSMRGSFEDDCLIALYADATDSAWENTTSDIRVWYTQDGSQDLKGPIGTPSENVGRSTLINLSVVSNGGAGGLVRNIHIHWNVSLGLSFQPGMCFQAGKTGTGSIQIDNIKHSGYIGGITGTGNVGISFGTTSDFTGNPVTNYSYEDLKIDCAAGTNAIAHDGKGANGPVTFDKVYAAGNLTLPNLIGSYVNAESVRFANYASAGSNANGTWSSLPGGRLQQAGYIAAAGATVNVTFPTPFKPGTTPRVAVEYINPAGGETASTMFYKITSLTNTGFTCTRATGVANCDFSWNATGDSH